VNDDEEHIRAVLDFIRPYKNVIDYELLPYMRFGKASMGFWADLRNAGLQSPDARKPRAAACDH